MSVIKILGVGSAGINAVDLIAARGLTGVSLAICDTDSYQLDNSLVNERIYIGDDITENYSGTNWNSNEGHDAAVQSLKKIKQYLATEIKMLVLITGLGGGTGSGATPVIARAAMEMGILTIAMVTTPFSFEGKFRMQQAQKALQEIKNTTDSFTIFSNDELRSGNNNLSMSDAFSKSDEIIYDAIKAIIDMITIPGYINVDFKDLRTVLKDAGRNLVFSHIGKGPNRALNAVQFAISGNPNSPRLNGAKYLLLNVSAGDEVTMDEVSIITDYIQEEAGIQADLIWGNNIDQTLGDNLRVTIVATGFKNEYLENYSFETSPDVQDTIVEKSEEKISLYFLEEEYSPDEIAEVISLLSDIYRSEGGDALIIKGQDIFEFTTSSIPVY